MKITVALLLLLIASFGLSLAANIKISGSNYLINVESDSESSRAIVESVLSCDSDKIFAEYELLISSDFGYYGELTQVALSGEKHVCFALPLGGSFMHKKGSDKLVEYDDYATAILLLSDVGIGSARHVINEVVSPEISQLGLIGFKSEDIQVSNTDYLVERETFVDRVIFKIYDAKIQQLLFICDAPRSSEEIEEGMLDAWRKLLLQNNPTVSDEQLDEDLQAYRSSEDFSNMRRLLTKHSKEVSPLIKVDKFDDYFFLSPKNFEGLLKLKIGAYSQLGSN